MICQLNISDKFKSLNFDKRKKNISFIILHYTETKTLEEAISLLTDQERKVSCHFILDINGKIFNLVDLENRAWHAGESKWKNFKDLNSHSIGIEISNPPYAFLEKVRINDTKIVIKKRIEKPFL